MDCRSDIWNVDKIDWSTTFDIGAKLLMGIKDGEYGDVNIKTLDPLA